VVRADFNGDRLVDEAWLLPSNTSGWALFAFMASTSGSYRVVRLEQDRKTQPQGFGIALVPLGNHKTACGKGYWDCKKGEPEVLNLDLPAIEFFRFESASSIFWWNRKSGSFTRTWVSD